MAETLKTGTTQTNLRFPFAFFTRISAQLQGGQANLFGLTIFVKTFSKDFVSFHDDGTARASVRRGREVQSTSKVVLTGKSRFRVVCLRLFGKARQNVNTRVR